jgi:DNA-binding MurR/RpiR family transcriptional regulator
MAGPARRIDADELLPLHYSRAVAGFEVNDRIGGAGRTLTAAERRVAQVILERPQLVAFGTVADLAGQAGAGAATVVRLAGKLGFEGFSALQSSVRRDLSHQLRPAVERIRELEGTRTSERHRTAMQLNVQATLDGVDHADLDKAVELLSDLSHPVLVLAGDAQHGVATQFVHDLGALRPGVEPVWGPDVAVQRHIATSAPGSTLVVIDLRRYETWLLDAARAAERAGHSVISLSDGPLSPIAMAAPVSFTLLAESVSPFESQVGTMALLELLVAIVAERLRDTAEARLASVEAAWAEARALSGG